MHKVRSLLDRSHERSDLLGLLRDELFVRDDQDSALRVENINIDLDSTEGRTTYEATTAQRSEDVDSEHSNVSRRSSLFFAPFFQLDALNILESDSGIDSSVDDAAADVHADSDGGVVGGQHSVPFGQFVNLSRVVLRKMAKNEE